MKASAEQALLHGHQVTGYSLLTNRPLNDAAWQLAKSSPVPFYVASSLPERYWEERLRRFARCFSCTDTEVADGIRRGIGDLLQRVTHRRYFGEPVITREMLIEAFTGSPATHALTPDIVAEKSRQQLNRLFRQPFHLGQLPFVLRPSIQKQLSDLVEQHAFIVLSGTGGNGKTTALWQWIEDCLTSRLPQQRGIYYHLDSADKVQRDFLAVRFCRWARVPTTHHWMILNIPEQIIDRLEIARNASTKLPLEHPLIFVLALDAVDEAFQQPDKDALKELLMWFWEQETQLNVRPRATLIITCRETKELARNWLRIISPHEKEPKPFRDIEVEVKEFSPDELVAAARQCLPTVADRFEKARQALETVLSTYFLPLMSFHHNGNSFGQFRQRMG
ncbi:MAG: NACHT domain-containing protein [Ktedonobacteraceae bacterium]